MDSFFIRIFVIEKETITNLKLTIMKKQAVITIKETTLYNDYDVNSDRIREDYLDFCENNETTPEEETPWDYISEILQMEWDDMISDIEDSKYNDECVVIGKVGFWFGNRDIEPQREIYLTDAIKKCINNCDFAIIKIVDGHIEVKGIHHDGTNDFEIHVLNKLGQRTEGADLTKECYYKKIKTDFWG